MGVAPKPSVEGEVKVFWGGSCKAVQNFLNNGGTRREWMWERTSREGNFRQIWRINILKVFNTVCCSFLNIFKVFNRGGGGLHLQNGFIVFEWVSFKLSLHHEQASMDFINIDDIESYRNVSANICIEKTQKMWRSLYIDIWGPRHMCTLPMRPG